MLPRLQQFSKSLLVLFLQSNTNIKLSLNFSSSLVVQFKLKRLLQTSSILLRSVLICRGIVVLRILLITKRALGSSLSTIFYFLGCFSLGRSLVSGLLLRILQMLESQSIGSLASLNCTILSLLIFLLLKRCLEQFLQPLRCRICLLLSLRKIVF